MAGTLLRDSSNPSDTYLSPGQRDLLVAALSSNSMANKPTTSVQPDRLLNHVKRSDSEPESRTPTRDAMPPVYDLGREEFLDTIDPSKFSMDDSEYADLFDADGQFDLENGSPQLWPSVPPVAVDIVEGHEKRKSTSDDVDDDDDHEQKRREGDEKSAKKPGRKLVTAEPSTKRKAQNRAAQRAFRERKEKHLKDLEQKVADLEKASESANHENGLLRAQVDRLQSELKDYRKRMSVTSGLSQSPPRQGPPIQGTWTNGSTVNPFEFTVANSTSRFTPQSRNSIYGVAMQSPPSRDLSVNGKTNVDVNDTHRKSQSLSPIRHANQKSDTSASLVNNQAQGVMGNPSIFEDNTLAGLFSPSSFFGGSGQNYGFDLDFTNMKSYPQTTFSPQHIAANVYAISNGSSTYNSDSPADSSASRHGTSSSCATSPEPYHQSPSKKAENSMSSLDGAFFSDQSPQAAFIQSPIGNSNTSNDKNKNNNNNNNNSNSIDWLANLNGGNFDPVLFGDYRDSQEAIIGNGSFSGGYFDDGALFNDFDNFTSQTQNVSPLPAATAAHQPELAIKSEPKESKLSCYRVWRRIEESQDFKNGNLDIDQLCTELKKKARCSETGAVIDSQDVDDVFKKVQKTGSTVL